MVAKFHQKQNNPWNIWNNYTTYSAKRKNKLLKKYRTIPKMKEASFEELEEILPNNIVIELKRFLEDYDIKVINGNSNLIKYKSMI